MDLPAPPGIRPGRTEMTSDGRPRGSERQVVERIVIAMHRDGGRCWRCGPDGADGCELLPWAIRRTVQHALTVAARRILAEHWPAGEGCPICRTPDCPALVMACAYLDLIGDDYVPVPIPSSDGSPTPGVSAAIAVRAADAADAQAREAAARTPARPARPTLPSACHVSSRYGHQRRTAHMAAPAQ